VACYFREFTSLCVWCPIWGDSGHQGGFQHLSGLLEPDLWALLAQYRFFQQAVTLSALRRISKEKGRGLGAPARLVNGVSLTPRQGVAYVA
jgi:hypothetical protein